MLSIVSRSSSESWSAGVGKATTVAAATAFSTATPDWRPRGRRRRAAGVAGVLLHDGGRGLHDHHEDCLVLRGRRRPPRWASAPAGGALGSAARFSTRSSRSARASSRRYQASSRSPRARTCRSSASIRSPLATSRASTAASWRFRAPRACLRTSSCCGARPRAGDGRGEALRLVALGLPRGRRRRARGPGPRRASGEAALLARRASAPARRAASPATRARAAAAWAGRAAQIGARGRRAAARAPRGAFSIWRAARPRPRVRLLAGVELVGRGADATPAGRGEGLLIAELGIGEIVEARRGGRAGPASAGRAGAAAAAVPHEARTDRTGSAAARRATPARAARSGAGSAGRRRGSSGPAATCAVAVSRRRHGRRGLALRRGGGEREPEAIRKASSSREVVARRGR